MIFMHVDNGKLLISAYDDIESAKKDIKGVFYKLQTGNYISQEFFNKVIKPDDMKKHSIAYIDADTYYIRVRSKVCDNCKHRIACMLDDTFCDKERSLRRCTTKSLGMKVPRTEMKHPQSVIVMDKTPITHEKTTSLSIQMYDYAKALAKLYGIPKDTDRLYEDIVILLGAQTNFLEKINGEADRKYIYRCNTLLPIVALRPVLLHTANDEGIPLIICSQDVEIRDYVIL